MTDVRKVTVAKAAGGELDFVLSDDTKDRYGDVIQAEGWDLRSFKRNPIALFNHNSDFPIGSWENVRVEGNRLIGRLKLAASGTSERIDELIRLVEQGILRAVSVGFKPLETEKLGTGPGLRFLKQELLETSLVSVPANPSAVQLARSLHVSDDTLRMVFGRSADEGQAMQRRGLNGEHAATPSLRKPQTMSTPLAKRIEDAQNELVRSKDELTNHLAIDDADPIITEELSDRIERQTSALSALQRAEAALAARSQPTGTALVPAATPGAPAIRRPLGVQAKETKPGDLIVRAAVCHALAHVTGKSVEHHLEDRYRDHEATHIVAKAAVAGATTTQSGWAAELVETAMADFLSSLRPVSIYPRLAELGTRLTFGPNAGAIKIPSRATSPSISGSFVAEGAPIPVRKLGLTSLTLSPKKMGVISVFTREIARYSNPAIEGLIREEILADTAVTLDSLLLDATASSSSRPAGLTNGVTAVTETAGGGYEAILADIANLAAPFDTANAGRNLALLMNPAQARKVRMTAGPNSSGFDWANQFLDEFTVIVSTTVPAGKVYMIDAADFVTAAGDTPEFDVSDQTVLHMEDTSPAQIAATGTPNTVSAPAQSMFQTASIALRMLLDVSWGMRRTGMVQYVEDVTW